MARFVRYVGPQTTVDVVTKGVALEFVQAQEKNRTPNAANKDRKNLSAAWSFGVKFLDNFPDGNPFKAVPKCAHTVEPHYVPPLEDFLEVERVATGQDLVLMTTFLHTAGRRSMVFGLRWADVDFARGRITLRHRKPRDGSEQKVNLAMTDELHPALMEHRRAAVNKWVFVQRRGQHKGKPFSENRGFPQDLCELAGVNPFGCHGIRGLTATLLHKRGVGLAEIQAILGHARATTTNLYLRHLGDAEDTKPHLQLLTSSARKQKPNTEPCTRKKGPVAANN